MFTAADLAGHRADSLAAMDATATVRRGAAASTGYGHGAGAPVVVHEDVRCRVVPGGSGTEGAGAGQTVAEAPWIVQLDGVLDVRPEDTISVVWDADATNAGATGTYSVVWADVPRSFGVNTRAHSTQVADAAPE